MKAKFIGRDGSCMLKKGKVYEIESVPTKEYSIAIKITAIDKALGTYCPYESLEAFLANWEPQKEFTRKDAPIFSEAEFYKAVDEVKRDEGAKFSCEIERLRRSYDEQVKNLLDENNTLKCKVAENEKARAATEGAIVHLSEALFCLTRK